MFTGDEAFENQMPESKRLCCLVHNIVRDVFIAPRGLYYRSQEGILKNPAFQGLQPHEVGQLCSYMLLNSVKTTKEQLERPDFEEQTDIFESLKEKDSWVVSKNGAKVVLSSLIWPGYHMYNLFGKHYNVYYGQGRKNLDFGFM